MDKQGTLKGGTFLTQRTLPFPPSSIYAAFESASDLARWWGPNGFTNTFEVFEFKVGGRWVFVMHGPDGSAYPNVNTFTEFIPNSRVVIRHVNDPHFVLTVALQPVATGTLLTWEQVFEDHNFARAVEHIIVPSNEQNLDRLTRLLEAM